MTDYRSRRIKAILIPADERMPIGDLEEHSIGEWLERANIRYMGFVNASSTMNLQFMIDDDGLSRQLAYNVRAHFLCQYPIEHPIVGNIIAVSQDYIDDGMDVVSLLDESAAWVKDPARADELASWRSKPVNREYIRYHRYEWPLPTQD